MDARLNLFENTIAMKFAKHVMSAGRVITESTLPAATQELVRLRASQINGCGFCTDMHTKEAARAGESQVRLNLVAAWREATVFTEAERAALELSEQGTRIADAAGGVSDEAWANAAMHYDEDQLAALVSLIALINAANRMNVITRQPAGDYQAGPVGLARTGVARRRGGGAWSRMTPRRTSRRHPRIEGSIDERGQRHEGAGTAVRPHWPGRGDHRRKSRHWPRRFRRVWLEPALMS